MGNNWRKNNVERARERERDWYARNAEAQRATKLAAYYANKERRQETSREWKARNKNRALESRREWYVENRQWALEYAKKYAAENEAYVRAYNVKWREENRDLYRTIKRQSRVKHAERCRIERANRSARKRGAEGKYGARDIQKLYLEQAGRCATCSKEFPQIGKCRFHIDHIMPLKLGGSNWPHNLQLLCVTCNCRKRDMHPDKWAEIQAG